MSEEWMRIGWMSTSPIPAHMSPLFCAQLQGWKSCLSFPISFPQTWKLLSFHVSSVLITLPCTFQCFSYFPTRSTNAKSLPSSLIVVPTPLLLFFFNYNQVVYKTVISGSKCSNTDPTISVTFSTPVTPVPPPSSPTRLPSCGHKLTSYFCYTTKANWIIKI